MFDEDQELSRLLRDRPGVIFVAVTPPSMFSR